MLFNNKLSFWYNDKKVQVFNTIMYLKLTHGKHSYWSLCFDWGLGNALFPPYC